MRYQIYPKYKLIVETYFGEFSLKNYSKMKHEQFNDPDYHASFDVLADFRQAAFAFNARVNLLLNFFDQNKDRFGDRKSALVVQTPLATSKAVLFAHQVNKTAPIDASVFCTIEGALGWLGLFDHDLLDELS